MSVSSIFQHQTVLQFIILINKLPRSQALGPELLQLPTKKRMALPLDSFHVWMCTYVHPFPPSGITAKKTVAIHNGLVIDLNRVLLYFLRTLLILFFLYWNGFSLGFAGECVFLSTCLIKKRLKLLSPHSLHHPLPSYPHLSFPCKGQPLKEIQTPVGLTCWNDWEVKLKLMN